MASVEKRILRRVAAHGKGRWVCTPKDFLDLGSRTAVDTALSRLAKAGKLRRVGRGLYDLPYFNKVLQDFNVADLDAAVKAIARRDGIRVMGTDMQAAHGLGLTPAVPAKIGYVTDGSARTVNVGGRTIPFQHRSPRLMRWHGTPVATVARALRWLGPYAGADPRVARALKRNLPAAAKRDLLRNLHALPVWSRPMVRNIATEPEATQ